MNVLMVFRCIGLDLLKSRFQDGIKLAIILLDGDSHDSKWEGGGHGRMPPNRERGLTPVRREGRLVT